MPEQSKLLAGRTFRWTFGEGPTAGKTYEHTFHPDGTVIWHEVAASGEAASAGDKKPDAGKPDAKPETKYASFEVAPKTHVVSYLSDSGYTLTVAMNLDTMRCYGFASNQKEWYPLNGTVEIVN